MAFSHVLVVFVAVIAAAGFWVMPPRQSIPAHLKGHPLVDVGKDFLSADVVDGLLQMSRDIGRISTASREYDSYSTLADNIGEATPYNAESKTCPQPLLMATSDKKRCILPGRVDVGAHFIRSGGSEAVKEDFPTLVSRVQPFQSMLFNWSEYKVADDLMKDPKFLDLAKAVCPKDKQYLDPFQFNLVVQVPGQTVAAHIDAPYFRRATRRTLPQWLLAAMVFSGLFREDFIDQVQLVGYYHKWTDTDRGGKFYFWNDDSATPHVSDPVTGSANSVDGSKVVHAAALYMPKRKPPTLSKDNVNELVYIGKDAAAAGGHRWGIEVNGKQQYTYSEDDIRFSAVYRARCFKHKEDKEKFLQGTEKNPWTVDEVLAVLEKDMKKRGAWPFAADETTADHPSADDRYALAMAILDTYVKYPYSPTAVVPFNYCALDRMYPALKHVLKYVC